MRGPPQFPDHRTVSYNAVLAGSFYKKLVFGDVKRTMDFFATLPGIDPERLGISGVSLGAELAVEYAEAPELEVVTASASNRGRTLFVEHSIRFFKRQLSLKIRFYIRVCDSRGNATMVYHDILYVAQSRHLANDPKYTQNHTVAFCREAIPDCVSPTNRTMWSIFCDARHNLRGF